MKKKIKKKVKLVCGVGINDLKGLGTEETKPYYSRWKGMLERCYSEKVRGKYPTYQNCTVCEEWLIFSNFKRWMETQDWKGKALDKDLLVYGNTVYSPETCCFINIRLNNFMIKSDKIRGDYPLGVWTEHYSLLDGTIKTVYRSHIGDGINGKLKRLGYFENPLSAHKAWQKAKIEQALVLANQQTDLRVKGGLLRVASKIQADHDNNLITEDF